MIPELNILALTKGQEQYIFVYDDQSEKSLVDAVRNQAANPALSLNWFDALVLAEKAHEQVSMAGTLSDLVTQRIKTLDV